MDNVLHGKRIPFGVKTFHTVWTVVLVPVWIQTQGPENFLWLSDIGLLGTCLALWLESRFLASMLAVGVVLPDLGWTAIFLGRLVIDAGPLERSGYMFDEDLSLFVRGLSLYHVYVPPLLVWMVHRLGYDRRALPVQIVFTCILLPVTYALTLPQDNINFVFGFGEPPELPVAQPFWLLAQVMGLTLLAYLPAHACYARWWSPRPA